MEDTKNYTDTKGRGELELIKKESSDFFISKRVEISFDSSVSGALSIGDTIEFDGAHIKIQTTSPTGITGYTVANKVNTATNKRN